MGSIPLWAEISISVSLTLLEISAQAEGLRLMSLYSNLSPSQKANVAMYTDGFFNETKWWLQKGV